MSRIGWRAWVLCGCLLTAGVPASAQVAVRDDRGVTVRLAHAPQRIVSLLPSFTEALCALGACDRVVGTDRFSDWPEAVRRLPKLGGLEDAQVERIAALRPDVVVVEASTRVVDRLEALGLNVVALEARSHADVRRTLDLLGRMLGAPAQADAAWARIEAQIDQAARTVPASLRGQRVYFEVDSTPYAAGASSFIGETLVRLGLANIVAAELGAFPRLNPEFVVSARPDLILASQDNLADMPRRPGWATLVALQRQRVCAFARADYELIVRAGPRMGEAAQRIARCLSGLVERPQAH